MKYKYIIFDGHNLLWQSLFINISEILFDDNVVYTGGIKQFLKRSSKLIEKFGRSDSLIYFCFDNPKTELNIRKEISNGEYKSARLNKKADKEIQKTFYILLEILKNYDDRYFTVCGENLEADRLVKPILFEADDLTKPLLDNIDLNNNNLALCISSDLDWARNINKIVHWFNFKDLYTIKDFIQKYKFNPTGNKLKMYKAIKGDNSDSIVNAVPYLPEEILIDIINTYNNPKELFDNLWKTDYKRNWQIKLDEAKKQIIINYQLVDFIDIEENIENLIFKCKRNLQKLKFYYNRLKMEYEYFMYNKEILKKVFLKKQKHKINKEN